MVYLTCAVGLSFGCSRTPARVEPPSLKAGIVAAAAMARYDKNGDGQVADDELEAAASLKAALTNLDQDKNGAVSQDEVSQRVGDWLDSKLGISTVNCTVKMDGKPVTGATVTFEPDEFLNGAVKTASGTTDDSGMAVISMPAADMPDPNMSGAQVGLYLVRVSKAAAGKETIPAEYNVATTLGAEVAIDSEGLRSGYVFELSSK